MLKSELIRPRLTIHGDHVATQSLPATYHYLNVATALIAMFKRHIGQSRGTLDDALRDYEGDSLDYPVIRGLASVLEARCTFDREPPVDPVDLREALFQRGPVTHKIDLFHPESRERAVAEVAAQYDLTPKQVESAVSAEAFETASAGEVLMFTRKPILKDVLAAIERCATAPP
jgi:uncharacterized protein